MAQPANRPNNLPNAPVVGEGNGDGGAALSRHPLLRHAVALQRGGADAALRKKVLRLIRVMRGGAWEACAAASRQGGIGESRESDTP